MKLQSIIRGIAITDRRGRFESDIRGLTADSRAVRPGDAFVAVRGKTHDGHHHIEEAVKNGAVAIVGEAWPDDLDSKVDPGVDVVLVPNSQRVLGLLASNFYEQPSKRLQVVGITGTNGKTTVTYVLEAIMKAAGHSVGILGSVESRYANQVVQADHTTPDPILLQGLLAQMVAADVTHVVTEVSSHALDQFRVQGVDFKGAGFTNLSRDHLDYHGTVEDYFESKSKLFNEVLPSSSAQDKLAVVSIDDAYGKKIAEGWDSRRGTLVRVSVDPESGADLVSSSAEYSLEGTKATLRTEEEEWTISTSLIGQHNLSNLLVSVGIAQAMGISRSAIDEGLSQLPPVPGRLEQIPSEDGKRVLVDYAHTPEALRQVLGALRPHVEGKLIVLFGAGGDRDGEKRVPMGQAVAEFADFAVVTNDNPRSEEPEVIAAQLEEGLGMGGLSLAETWPEPMEAKKYLVQLDRQVAIFEAVEKMEATDLLLVAGRGHESIQVIKEKRLRLDDRDAVRRALAKESPIELEDVPLSKPTLPRAATQTVTMVDVVDEEAEAADAETVNLSSEEALEEVEEISAESVEGEVEAASPPDVPKDPEKGGPPK